MNIVLLEPEIPQNTANIGRSCACTGSSLHLIKPLGFTIDEKSIRRAGMDYWNKLDLHIYDSFEHFLEVNGKPEIFMATTKAPVTYDKADYRDNSFIMFGKESKGIPEEILLDYKDTAIRIPMLEEFRSLNLSSAVAVVLYEALRQLNFPGLSGKGELHRHSWENT